MPTDGILVASDLSPRSDRALARGLALAREWGVPLEALHVVDADLPDEIADYQRVHAERLLMRQIAADPQARDLKMAVRSVRGMAFAAITAAAEEAGARLVVLGSHRENLLKDVFIGTTAERVLRACRRPVLVAKGPVLGPYRRILVGMDFSLPSLEALRTAHAFWPGAEITALHVADPPYRGAAAASPPALADYDQDVLEEARRELGDTLARLGKAGAVQGHVEIGEPIAVFTSLARHHEMDLVVVGTHGRSGLAHLLLGSFAEAVAGHLPCDVMAVQGG